MKLLLVKLSSLGDLIHVFPALTALQKEIPNLEVTWVVESVFGEVPLWHPAVKKVIKAPLRALKEDGFITKCKKIFALLRQVRAQKYDVVIDAQGLFKSALLAKYARGISIGFDKPSARESVWWLYNKRMSAPKSLHAIVRMKNLFSAITALPDLTDLTEVNYQLAPWVFHPERKALFFAHGTTWSSKHYPDEFWQQLVQIATGAGFEVWLPHANAHELKRAEFLKINDQVKILPKMTLTALKDKLNEASGAICVDTGLAHIIAALGLPAVTLYGPTDPSKIGTIGKNQRHLAAKFVCAPCEKRTCFHPERNIPPSPPCFRMLPPRQVLTTLQELLLRVQSSINSGDQGLSN